MHQINDPFYATILNNMRNGYLTEDQRTALRSRILGNNSINSQEWKNAVFLVTRNNFHVLLNLNATIEYAQQNKQLLIYFCTEDSYNRTILIRKIQQSFLSTSDTKDNALCSILPLSINIKKNVKKLDFWKVCTCQDKDMMDIDMNQGETFDETFDETLDESNDQLTLNQAIEILSIAEKQMRLMLRRWN
ncbi:5500_t:CDS:2, partial [Cetraspora pellucida]